MRGSATGDRKKSLATRGNKMNNENINLLANIQIKREMDDFIEVETVPLESSQTDNSKSDEAPTVNVFTEAELCNLYGYDLALSPSETNIPDNSEDPLWLSEDSNDGQNGNEFDLLEPFLLDPVRPTKCSELTWFSDSSNDSHSSVKDFINEFDDLGTAIFSSEYPSNRTESVIRSSVDDQQDNGYGDLMPNAGKSPGNPSGSEASSATGLDMTDREEGIAETTKHIAALLRRMTLGQKMRFYAWFDSGVSIGEAAFKSKIPDLIPPPVRNPNCKLSKKRLRRLSSMLPTIYLQRQFVYETYCAGAEPKHVMKYMLRDLDLEHLMCDFEQHLAFEENAVQKKLLRRHIIEQPGPKAAGGQLSEEVPQPSAKVLVEEPDTGVGQNPKRTDTKDMVNNELKAYHFWREKGLPVSEAKSRAKMLWLNPEILRHPDCKHSLENLQQLAKALPNKESQERVIVGVYYEGKDLGEVLNDIMAKMNGDVQVDTERVIAESMPMDNLSAKTKPQANAIEMNDESPDHYLLATSVEEEHKISQLTLKQLKKYYSWRNQGVSHGDALSKAMTQNLILRPVPHPDCQHSWEDVKCLSNSIMDQHQRQRFRVQVYYGGKSPEEAMNLLYNDWKTAPLKPLSGCTSRKTLDSEEVERKQLRVNQLKKYYKWCNQGFNHGEAITKARTKGLVPKSVPHPSCQFTWEQVKSMSKSVECPKRRSLFQTEVFYGGKTLKDLVYLLPPSAREVYSGAHQDQECKDVQRDQRFPEEVDAGGLVTSMPHQACQYERPDQRFPGEVHDSFAGVTHRNYQEDVIDMDTELSDGANAAVPWRQNDEPLAEGPLQPELEWQNPFQSKKDELSWFELNWLKKYYKWRNQGFSHGEAVVKAKTKGLKPKEVPHSGCRFSWGEVRSMSRTVEAGKKRERFKIEVFYGGRDPKDMVNLLSSSDRVYTREQGQECQDDETKQTFLGEVNASNSIPRMPHQASQDEKTNGIFPNNLHDSFPRLLDHDEQDDVMDMELSEEANGAGTLQQIKEPSAVEPLYPEWKWQNPIQAKEVEQLGLTKLKRYYMWRNHGLNHGEAIAKAQTKGPAPESVPHPGCRFSWEDVISMSRVVQGFRKRQRFRVEVFYGGKNPKDLAELPPSSSRVHSGPEQGQECQNGETHQRYLGNDYGGDSVASMSRQASQEGVVDMELCDDDAADSFRQIEEPLDAKSPVVPVPVFDLPGNSSGCITVGCNHPDALQERQLPATPVPDHPYKRTRVPQHDDHMGIEISGSDILHIKEPLMEKCSHPLASSVVPVPVHDRPGNYSSWFASCLNYPDELHQFQTMAGPVPSVPPSVPFQLQAAPPVATYPLQPQVNNEVCSSDTSAEPLKSYVVSPKVKTPLPEDDGVKCFIVPATFPKELLSVPQMDAIENNILEAILEMDDDELKPCFKMSFRSNGRYGIICNDQFSENWLYKYLRMYQPWEGACLRLISENPNKVKANAVFPLCSNDDDSKILRFIEKQNHGLNVDQWVVVHRWDSNGNTLMDLFIDEKSAEILHECSKVSFKLGTAEIITARLPARSREGCGGATAASPPRPVYFPPQPTPPPLQTPPPPSPPSLPPPPPPSPPPPPPPPPKDSPVIDTSLGALLQTSKGQKELPRRELEESDIQIQSMISDLCRSITGPELELDTISDENHSRGTSKRIIDREHRKRRYRDRKRSRSSSVECSLPYLKKISSTICRSSGRKRSRSSSIDLPYRRNSPIGRRSRDLERSPSPARDLSYHRRSRSSSDHHHLRDSSGSRKSKDRKKYTSSINPKRSRSTSRERRHKKKHRKRRKKQHSMSHSLKKHSWLDWFYPGDERPLENTPAASPYSVITSDDGVFDNRRRFSDQSVCLKPPRLTSPYSDISSMSDSSVENTEYAEYLGESTSSKPIPCIDLRDST